MKDWIVVVDDEALGLANARSLLLAHDMRVSCLRSGRELLRFMEKNEPNLILLDIMMPEMDGFETFHSLRKQEEEQGRPATPVIFLTGDNDSETERQGLKAGASDFILKPFNKDVLIRRIRNILSNSRTIETLTEEATLDGLTGFLNKISGRERLEEICQSATGALTQMDLDNFKLVNDICGHNMGDRVLTAFSDILRHNIRSEDMVCRSGGDEFLAFFTDIVDDGAIRALTERISSQFLRECERLLGKDVQIPIGISYGIVMVPEQGRDYSLLFQYADTALSHVKQNGKHGLEIYRPSQKSLTEEEDLNREMARLSHIVEERGSGQGAFLLGQDSFSWNYRFIMRLLKRSRGKANKLLFSLSSEDPSYDSKRTQELFGSVLQKTLRSSDILMQTQTGQFFLLLPELSGNDVPVVVKRIMKAWEKEKPEGDISVRYVYETVSFYEDFPGEEAEA